MIQGKRRQRITKSLFHRQALSASEADLEQLERLQVRGLHASASGRTWPTRSAVMLWALQTASEASDDVLKASLASSPPMTRGRPKIIEKRVPAKPLSIPLPHKAWAPLPRIEKRYRQWRPRINRGGVLRAILRTLDTLSEEAFAALVQKAEE